ncbi:MAG: helix-turn-helix domain-containing protein [Pseudomonadota bacterium]
MSRVNLARKPEKPAPNFGEFDGVLIDAGEWRQKRYGWAEAVRRDPSLSDGAKLVAHTLAFDFANALTMQCNPSFTEIAQVLGASKGTRKRHIHELVDAGWIVIVPGQGSGNNSWYGFVSRADVIAIKGRKFDPSKRVQNCTLSSQKSDAQKGSNLNAKGVKFEHPLYIDKPYKNHKGVRVRARTSENPSVIADVCRRVEAFRQGRASAFDDAQDWILSHLLAAEMLTDDELETIGIFAVKGERDD